MSQQQKLILVIGATGAQGLAVVDALLAPSSDGTPSPYSVRALTRDPKSSRAQALADKGVELANGSFEDLKSVVAALDGCYGAYVNTDSFTVGEIRETYYGMRIFELATQAKGLKHYVWSNLESIFRETGYDPRYYVEHYAGKGRVGDWLQQQRSEVSDTGLTWSMLTTGPYMDMLDSPIYGPLNRHADGTFVFATPLGSGHVPLVALADIGYFARYIFDHRAESSRKDYRIASDVVSWEDVVSTFTRVTGQKAVAVYQTVDEWMANFTNTDKPHANGLEADSGAPTWKESMGRWWNLYRDDVIKKDMAEVRRLHPGVVSLEQWMRERKYQGSISAGPLKNSQDGKDIGLNFDRISQL